MAYLAQNFADSFGEGLGFGLRAYQAGQENIRRNAEEERQQKEFEFQQQQRARALVQQRAQDEALQALTSATQDGIVEGGVAGLSAPSLSSVYQGSAGYGQGMPAVQEVAGDYQREMARFGAPQEAAKYDTSGVTARVATDRDTNRLMQQYALASRDVGAYAGLQEKGRVLEARSIRDNTVKAFRENPAGVVDAWSQRFNPMDSGIPIIVGERDKDGFVTLSMVDPNSERAKGVNIRLSPAQQLKVAQGVALLDAGFSDEAMELLDGVDERIGKLALTFNQMQGTLAGNANEVARTRLADERDRQRIDIAQQELGIRRQTANAARRADRQIDPATLARLNDLSAQIAAETDPAKKRTLTNEWYRVNAIASTQLGRAMNPPQQNVEMTPLDKARLDAYYKAVAELPPDVPRAQVDALAARFGVQGLIGGGGGLPAWGTLGGAQPAPAAAATAAPPPQPLSAFEERRRAVFMQEEERRRAAEAAAAQAREAERQRLMQQRPDLQQMGGLRYFN